MAQPYVGIVVYKNPDLEPRLIDYSEFHGIQPRECIYPHLRPLIVDLNLKTLIVDLTQLSTVPEDVEQIVFIDPCTGGDHKVTVPYWLWERYAPAEEDEEQNILVQIPVSTDRGESVFKIYQQVF